MKGHKVKTKTGIVIKDLMDKTVTVASEKRKQHPVFGKFIRQRIVYKVHDEKNEGKTGDEVEIMETRPWSKTKRWRLVRILKKSTEHSYDNDANQVNGRG
ncbi:MAG: 30S ribosomal protein S17 [Planctomycetota bacterium]